MHHNPPEPTIDLLARLLGKRTARRVFRGSLVDLFGDLTAPEDVRHQLRTARELIQRLMLEEMRQRPVLTNPRTVSDYLTSHFLSQEREIFAALFLDNRHHLIAAEEMFQGTVDGAAVHPREVVKRALQLNAAAVILAHNHPSGVAEPSQADELITIRIRDALGLVDIRVLDHLVVGHNKVTSLAERGVL